MRVFTVKPLDDRTGFKGNPKRSPFDSSWSATLELLERELKHLGAKNVIVEVDCLPGAIRLDGQLYANARVNSPAIRLHFDSDQGHLSYETDAFLHWGDNVRAVALALEALRRVDRYGIGRGGEQYRGYLALEAGTGIALGGMTSDDARDVLLKASRYLAWDEVDAETIYRSARSTAHPDRQPDGDRTWWDEVEQAAKVLGLAS